MVLDLILELSKYRYLTLIFIKTLLAQVEL